MSQPANNATNALQAADDALNHLGVAIGLVSDLLGKLQRKHKNCELSFDSSGQFTGMSYRDYPGRFIPADSQSCIEVRSDCEFLPKYVDSLWKWQTKADQSLVSLPSAVLEKLNALTGKPWLASVRRDCLDVILKWPGESAIQYSLGAHKVGGSINEILEKASNHDPHPTWKRYRELLDGYRHDLIAVRDTVQGHAESASKTDSLRLPASADTMPNDVNQQPDKPKKSGPIMPDNVDVRDFCKILENNRELLAAKKTTINALARKFTHESAGNDPKAQNLTRQARRFRHLWNRSGS